MHCSCRCAVPADMWMLLACYEVITKPSAWLKIVLFRIHKRAFWCDYNLLQEWPLSVRFTPVPIWHRCTHVWVCWMSDEAACRMEAWVTWSECRSRGSEGLQPSCVKCTGEDVAEKLWDLSVEHNGGWWKLAAFPITTCDTCHQLGVVVHPDHLLLSSSSTSLWCMSSSSSSSNYKLWCMSQLGWAGCREVEVISANLPLLSTELPILTVEVPTQISSLVQEHTWYLSLLLHKQHFQIQHFTPEK